MNAEKRHLDLIASLPCVACLRLGLPTGSPVHVHHIRQGDLVGMGEKAPAGLTIPLCPEHHQGAFSVHGSPRQFRDLVGSELHLLADTMLLIEGRLDPC